MIRQKVVERLPEYGMSYFDVRDKEGKISELVKAELEEFIKNELSSISNNLKILKLIMPWRRMFEVDIDAKYIK